MASICLEIETRFTTVQSSGNIYFIIIFHDSKTDKTENTIFIKISSNP